MMPNAFAPQMSEVMCSPKTSEANNYRSVEYGRPVRTELELWVYEPFEDIPFLSQRSQRMRGVGHPSLSPPRPSQTPENDSLTNELFRQILVRKTNLEYMPYSCPRCRWRKRQGKVAFLQISRSKAVLVCSNKKCAFPIIPPPGFPRIPKNKIYIERKIDEDWIPSTSAEIFSSEPEKTLPRFDGGKGEGPHSISTAASLNTPQLNSFPLQPNPDSGRRESFCDSTQAPITSQAMVSYLTQPVTFNGAPTIGDEPCCSSGLPVGSAAPIGVSPLREVETKSSPTGKTRYNPHDVQNSHPDRCLFKKREFAPYSSDPNETFQSLPHKVSLTDAIKPKHQRQPTKTISYQPKVVSSTAKKEVPKGSFFDALTELGGPSPMDQEEAPFPDSCDIPDEEPSESWQVSDLEGESEEEEEEKDIATDSRTQPDEAIHETQPEETRSSVDHSVMIPSTSRPNHILEKAKSDAERNSEVFCAEQSEVNIVNSENPAASTEISPKVDCDTTIPGTSTPKRSDDTDDSMIDVGGPECYQLPPETTYQKDTDDSMANPSSTESSLRKIRLGKGIEAQPAGQYFAKKEKTIPPGALKGDPASRHSIKINENRRKELLNALTNRIASAKQNGTSLSCGLGQKKRSKHSTPEASFNESGSGPDVAADSQIESSIPVKPKGLNGVFIANLAGRKHKVAKPSVAVAFAGSPSKLSSPSRHKQALLDRLKPRAASNGTPRTKEFINRGTLKVAEKTGPFLGYGAEVALSSDNSNARDSFLKTHNGIRSNPISATSSIRSQPRASEELGTKTMEDIVKESLERERQAHLLRMKKRREESPTNLNDSFLENLEKESQDEFRMEGGTSSEAALHYISDPFEPFPSEIPGATQEWTSIHPSIPSAPLTDPYTLPANDDFFGGMKPIDYSKSSDVEPHQNGRGPADISRHLGFSGWNNQSSSGIDFIPQDATIEDYFE